MAARAFDRAFNKAAVGSLPTSVKDETASFSKLSIPLDSPAELDTQTQPGQATTAISRIMRADKEQDLFRLVSCAPER